MISHGSAIVYSVLDHVNQAIVVFCLNARDPENHAHAHSFLDPTIVLVLVLVLLTGVLLSVFEKCLRLC